MSVDSVSGDAGCFGKIPAAGDFVTRRLPRSVVLALDDWLQCGLLQLRDADHEGRIARYRAAPVWSALVPSGVVAGRVLLGAVAASQDRVGRLFPLCLFWALAPERIDRALLAESAQACSRLGDIASRAVHDGISVAELDRMLSEASEAMPSASSDQGKDDAAAAILDLLGVESDELARTVPLSHARLPWPDLPARFDPRGRDSYWWTGGTARISPRGFVHSGLLDADLFGLLFGGEA